MSGVMEGGEGATRGWSRQWGQRHRWVAGCRSEGDVSAMGPVVSASAGTGMGWMEAGWRLLASAGASAISWGSGRRIASAAHRSKADRGSSDRRGPSRCWAIHSLMMGVHCRAIAAATPL